MNQSDKLYKSAVKNMVIGFAYYKIITDKKGKPINFKCLDVNRAFLEKTGLKAKDVIGKNISQVFPKTSKEKADWIRLCGKVALQNQKHTIEQYFKTFKRWLRVDLFSPSKGYFVTGLIDITKRKLAEEALKQSFEKYYGLVQNVNIGVYRSQPDEKGQFLEVNPALVNMLGYTSAKELMQRPINDIYENPEDRRIFLTKIKQNRPIQPGEIKLKKKDGAIITALITSTIHRNSSGKIDWIDGVIEDITERKQQEDALHRREAILEAVAFAADCFLKSAVWESSIQEILARLGNAAQVSRVYIFKKHLSPAGRLLTSQRHEWVSEKITPQIDNPLMQNFDVVTTGFTRWEKTLTKGKVLHGNIRDFPVRERKILSAQNIISIAVVPIFTGQTLWGFIGFDECIKERKWTQIEIDSLKAAASIFGSALQEKQVEKGLLESEEKYRSLINNINVGIFRFDGSHQGEILEANLAMAKLLGYKSVDELKYASVVDLYQNPNDRKITLEKLRKFGFIKNEERRLKKKDGTPIIASASAHAQKNEMGKIVWINGALEDITERKRAEQALKESEEKYRGLVNNVTIGVYRNTPDEKGRFIEANPAMAKIFGYKSNKELIQISIYDLYQNPQDRYRLLKKFRRQDYVIGEELNLRKKDNTPIIVRLFARAHKNNEGKIDWIDGVIEDITERKKELQVLREQADLLEQSHDAIIVRTFEGVIVYWNQGAERVYGWSPKEALGKITHSFLKTIFPVSKKTMDNAIRKLDRWEGELIHTRRDGNTIIIDSRQVLQRDSNGQPINVLEINRDITEQQKAASTLKESEEKYHSLVKNVNIGVFRSEPAGAGRFIEVNPALVHMLDYSSERELMQLSPTDLYLNPKARADFLNKLKKHGFVTAEELKFKKKSGSIFIASVTARVHRNKTGKIDWVDGVIEDITERKRADNELRQSEIKFRRIVENSKEVIMLTRSDAVIEYLSPACKEVLGYEPEDLVGTVPNIFYKDDVSKVQKTLTSAIRGKEGSNFEYRIVTKKGKVKWVNHSWSPIIENGKVQIVVSAVSDITERKRAEEVQKKTAEQTIICQKELLKLGKMKTSSFSTSIKKIIKTDAITLNVERVSYWSFSQDHSELVCEDLYLKSKNTHEKGLKLQTDTFPRYFRGLEKGRIIPTDDTCNDPRTSEFAESYLKPSGITSMIDVPVRLHGKVVGVICHEHIGPLRKWTSEEQNFATSIADFISLYLEDLELKHSEKILKESEEKYRSLVENVNVGIWRSTADPSGKILESNPAMVRILGYNSPVELKRVALIDLYQSPQDRMSYLKKISKFGSVKSEELKLKKKDGTPIIVSLSARANRDKSGKIKWIDGVIENISERKKVENALRVSEERYRTIFETANDAICIFNNAGIAISGNQRLFEMTGLSKKDLGSHVTQYSIFPEKSMEIIKEKMATRFAGKEVSPYEVEILPINGTPKTVEINATLLRNPDGEIWGDLAIIRDITERKQIETSLKQAKEAAETANKAKTAFLHNMSHELRSPMTSILGFTDVLLDNETDLDNKEMLDIIKKSGVYLLKIINDLLDLSRIEAGRIKLEKTTCNTFKSAQEIYKRYKLIAYERGINFHLNINKNLPKFIIADCTKISQIISNLLDNAFKFTEQGTIELYLGLKKQTTTKESILEFYVEDTGIGIPRARLELIFERFVQGEFYISKKYGGAGLGLPIIKELTELMQGKISVESKLAHGTKFTVRIPVKIVKNSKKEAGIKDVH